jgi:hypothetical protein
VCIGIAVPRIRLRDIGLVISRALTCTAVTALLAGMHAGLVLLATRVPAFTTPVAAGPDAVPAHLPAAVYQALGPAHAPTWTRQQ